MTFMEKCQTRRKAYKLIFLYLNVSRDFTKATIQ